MADDNPQAIVLAGPNGAGKSTAAPRLLRDALAVDQFVNADAIAEGPFRLRSETAAIEAGRIMLKRLAELAFKRVNFAFETTLASRTFVPWLEKLTASGWRVHLIFLALPNAETAMGRVETRVRLGGHNVPEDVVRRRFAAGLRNFFQLYGSIATSWLFYDNSWPARPILLAKGASNHVKAIDRQLYRQFSREHVND
ncbi:MAG: zeta toxin family protein [Deltaproteobacteria bacterium]|jgi:predicted ABC-type ATPase|nr:zeta toxin family protein [Deltaproteobacteria bacterium]